ncbi:MULTISPECIES: HK97-gp10 family putative phage morphogenesis protein [unclassified Rhizobium]|uniref:HK97-gp10 family putative phage morphogenesis protein n=1 Tax=unclassified Rhizobium TaxID=2613769 RepID=UPI001ADAE498|nr:MULTISPECIES: HK97-gp10 family putative phage morphogenesis protein [unclassified Rhizobium]MBO9099998.1 HK97 gp10 family phage protein [Rhizobium sp. L58/93]QXZ82809.1 HK97 gp10 family phage protein [Rhizobium sp. K1/93]QXZ89678.1 HK97 gp10 family phage protein [Rhizobium sp. K15/93]
MTKIRNVARLRKKLTQLPPIAKAMIRTQMAATADEVTGMMKRLAPVLESPAKDRRPGALRDSIGWTWGKAPKGASVVATVKIDQGAGMTITIYAGSAEAFYARWQEFGTQDAPAQPFFYVSWRASKKSAVRKIRKSVRDAAKKVASLS